jgi:hypothetical protein
MLVERLQPLPGLQLSPVAPLAPRLVSSRVLVSLSPGCDSSALTTFLAFAFWH